jgi:hypothetical protein
MDTKEVVDNKVLETRIEFGESRQMINKIDGFELPTGQEVVKIELACGKNKKEGFKGLDKYPLKGVDIVHDLMEFPWPFENESVYEFRTEHFIEHIPMQLKDGRNGLVTFMEEVYRCLQMHGTVEIVGPHYMTCEAFQDPTHYRYLTDNWIYYFDRSITEDIGLGHYTGECNFEMISRSFKLAPEWESRADEARAYAMKHYWNVIKEMKWVLRKKPMP